ncbi:hypothetical protein DOTSEDRAFT_69144 [Dothistroma septosporum NZE10]|uniref:Uncharacterized protein n=1 Tax=Dothistroma septosporum (strain NZE10 / CBS 128990) TaxID=675120 RepID=N1PXY6_DOTSN|nr:hypothetical protein DOTSEDRAFT_69144 [Dothistroma septosporum NZE10]
MLRYREGRQQVQHWLSNIVTDRAICKQVSIVCVQYFEQPHRSTAMLVDVKTFQVSNRESWIHPLLGKPLKTLREVEQELDAAKKEIEPATTYHYVPAFLHELVNLMTVPLSKSRLMLCESMANSRLHGYTDFQLRFEVITIIYSNVG